MNKDSIMSFVGILSKFFGICRSAMFVTDHVKVVSPETQEQNRQRKAAREQAERAEQERQAQEAAAAQAAAAQASKVSNGGVNTDNSATHKPNGRLIDG